MRPRIEQPATALILRALTKHDLTVYDLEKIIGVDKRNLREYMTLLHKRKQVHIVDWQCHGRGPKVPVWALGDEPDAERPPARSWAEQQKINRTRQVWVQLNRRSV